MPPMHRKGDRSVSINTIHHNSEDLSMTCNPRNMHSFIRFFKIVTSTNIQDGTLKIPDAFTKKYSGDLSNPMFLKTPDDKKWEVHLTKKDGDIWIHKGWNEFATHYSIDHGHMLMFQYEKTSHFKIYIFNKSTLEIEYHVDGNNQHEQNNLVENLDEKPTCKKTRPKSQISSLQPHKKSRIGASKDVGTSSKLKKNPKLVQVKEESEDTTECLNVNDQEPKNSTSKIAEALNKAKNYKTNNPFFTVVMTYSYANKYMYIPVDFEQKYMKEKQSVIVLQVLDNGRTWNVKHWGRHVSTGWKKFAFDNNLKVGDVCLFEMIKSNAYAFKVLIFRLGEEHSLPPQVHGDGVNWVETARIPGVECKTMSYKGKKATQNSLHASSCSFKSSEVKKESDQFASTLKNPHFTIKVISSHADVYKPRIHNSFSEKYLCHKKIVTLQFNKNLWHVRLASCPSEPSTKLSTGWSKFVEENKLEAGDVCVFELVNKEDLVFDAHIFRGCN
ncbi:transcriptional factor B3 family protein [Medicago truncatula]|uniref:Transcriptional factor B3 family protein n=1 Tax=Medicago truncatula TaxID=3880 RepID=G7L911_MEDTR|nr:transcriptional factor B3 family protein [Medicago truncatula]